MSYRDGGYFRTEVHSTRRLTPHMVRIRFSGGDLPEFRSSGQADECIGITFPAPGSRVSPDPVLTAGTWGHPEDAAVRVYSVRHWDAEKAVLTVDFVVHEGGIAAAWAMDARVGDSVVLHGPDGWYRIPADTDWQLLVADMTGLPALGRIVEELPAGARAHVIAEIVEGGDIQPLRTAATVTYEWITGSGNGHAPSALTDAVRRHPLPPGRGYVWFAGEAAPSREVRKLVRREWGWEHSRFTVLGYWRVAKEEWLARYRELAPDLADRHAEALAAGTSHEVADEMFEEELERVGL
ncbi:siderophore-interacting protein [Nakamurella silvestris]|nr:siderophore-interacting protein [Nakamurella silvestris]